MLRAHTAVVHAVLVNGRDAGVEEAVGHRFYAVDDELRNGVDVGSRLEAHDAREFAAHLLHARDATIHLSDGDIPRGADVLGPVENRGAEAINLDAGGSKFAGHDVEGRVGEVVEVGLLEPGHFDATHLDVFPAQLP